MGFWVLVGVGVVANPRLVGLVVFHGVSHHRAPLDVGLVGGAGVIVFYRDFQVLRGDAGGGFIACQEVKVASDKVDRATLLVVLGVAVFFSAMFRRLPLSSFVHFEVVDGGD